MKIKKHSRYEETGIYTFFNRRNLTKLLCLAALCMGFAVGACDLRKADSRAETNSKKDSNMESTQPVTTIQDKIPPIDAAAATKTETATFALG
jgi:hypothetical protein